MENTDAKANALKKEQTTPKKHIRIATIILFVLTAIFLLAALVFLMFRFFLMTFICLLCSVTAAYKDLNSEGEQLFSKQTHAGSFILIFIFTFFTIVFPPFTLSTKSLWKYPVFREYIAHYENVREPSWLPDFEKDVRSDFAFNYVINSLQGYGRWRIDFITDTSTAERYAEKYAQEAVYVIPLRDFGDYGIYHVNGDASKVVHVEFDEDFWEDASGYATAYILYTNLNWNHAFTSAVIVDPVTGMVELIECG